MRSVVSQWVCIMDCKMGEVSVRKLMVWQAVVNCNRENIVPYGRDDSVPDGLQALHDRLPGDAS